MNNLNIQSELMHSIESKTNEISFGSLRYYCFCAAGGALSCGLTHTLLTPLDLIKCRMQVDSRTYPSILKGLEYSLRQEGARVLVRGWSPTILGYSVQGLCKFGFYEKFKTLYSDCFDREQSYRYRTAIYLAASASAEFLADIALAPFEACKVRIQTVPTSSARLRKVFPEIWSQERYRGFYKGLVPLWLRQIPYTMMKFSCFELTVEMLYNHLMPKPKEKCNKSEQLIITFIAGYISGIFCCIVSHPADTIVSKLNQNLSNQSWRKTLSEIGFFALWKGIIPRILMIGTLTASQWFIYDAFKIYTHLPRPSPPKIQTISDRMDDNRLD
ncbi:Phosphate carrier protein [Sarcoptes scabiei]|uniref:Phosphate carrier protein, mitochondrial n=1 Tax=Sarcoptes scabiei TaxID=52283 RepID=A0A132AE96_SARSC|nr:Phosphate carrier protein [Sarcoptes scabiei]KPM09308.1 phosphate carrier protein-like protein [Sarcoptes scabiei]